MSTVDTHHLHVPRAARYATLGDPREGIDSVWFLLHGYGQLASEFLESARALAASTRFIVAPEGLSRFYLEDHQRVGASWMTKEDRLLEIDDYIRYLDLIHDQIMRVCEPTSSKINLLGFSQGVATATRWAIRGSAEVGQLVLWGSPLPHELADAGSMAPLQTMRLTLVGGHRDRFLDEAAWEDERRRLRDAGVVFEELHFNGGHRLDDNTLRKMSP